MSGVRSSIGASNFRSRLDRGLYLFHPSIIYTNFPKFFSIFSRWQVFSEAQNRWIHIDPSDNVVDAPLMYQHGWKRKVDYVIAFSHEDIQDVTWRYANNHMEAIRNRQRCTEAELLKTILLLREKRQKNLSVARKKYLKRRNLREVIELMVERQPSENEKRGRSSGSLSWRLTRGEEQECSSNNVNRKFSVL